MSLSFSVRRMYRLVLMFILLGGALPVAAEPQRPDPLFPFPQELQPDVRFWIRVYSEVSTQQGLIHDRNHLNIVYQLLDIPPGSGPKEREMLVKQRKKHYQQILLDLAKGLPEPLPDDHRRVKSLWPRGTTPETFEQASDAVRFQLGQSNRFREGIVRSGRWLPYIHEQFSELDIPQQLASLPHVESSFQADARSHAGASGLWQFTRGTGRRFLRIDHVIDERLDPYEATRAAGLLLKDNYEKTGTWPLALTAYNHGAAGVQRAIETTGGTDLVKILREYKGRTFGFASRNFYNAFMAANTIDRQPEEYFGPIQRDAPLEVEFVELPNYYTAQGLQQAFGLKSNIIKSMNPALQDPVWRKHKLVPKGYTLRLPVQSVKTSPSMILAQVPASEQSSEQHPDTTYRVQKGDALSTIARRYRVPMSELMAANKLTSKHRIRIGQVLKIPTVEVGKSQRYIVKKGDTLELIARRTRVPQSRLMALNGLEDKNRIYVGQRLRLH